MDQSNLQDTINSMPPGNFDTNAPTQFPEKPKKQKTLIIILSVFLVFALVAAGVFAYLYFSNQGNTNQDDSNQTQTDTTSDTQEPMVADEEVEITDPNVIQELDQKIAILHGTEKTDPTLTISMGLHHEYPLYINGTLSEAAKLAHLARTAQQTFVLSPEEKESIIAEQGYDNDMANYVRGQEMKGIKADVFSAEYVDLFGQQPSKEGINDQNYCPKVMHNVTYDFYYLDARCGGTGPYTSSYYKSKYTADSDHAYIYISAGTVNAENNVIYCDVINSETIGTNPPDICGQWSNEGYNNYNNFALDGSNYQDFAQYRFVFNKADNGTYYFDKVEKVTY